MESPTGDLVMYLMPTRVWDGWHVREFHQGKPEQEFPKEKLNQGVYILPASFLNCILRREVSERLIQW